MKKIILFFFICLPQFVLSQNFIPFQGIALDANGKTLSIQKIGIKISILKDNPSGTVAYSESHSPVTDVNGLFQLNIGTGIAITSTFATIDWSTLTYFLKVEMDIAGGSNYSLISNTQMGFVPFAFYAKNGGSLTTSNLIPYVGATKASDLGSFDLKVNGITIGMGNSQLNTNAVFGRDGLFRNTTGSRIIAIGTGTLEYNTTGGDNSAMGWQSLNANTIGNANTAVGSKALNLNTSGNANTAIGSNSLSQNTIGSFNIGIGLNTLAKNLTGESNIAIGMNSMQNFDPLANPYTISNNIGIGAYTLENLKSSSGGGGNSNIAIGVQALQSATTGRNIAIGGGALRSVTTGEWNLGIGGSVYRLGNGFNNIAIGHQAMISGGDNANNNLIIGRDAGTNLNSEFNTSLGHNSLTSTTTGSANVAIGNNAGFSNTVGVNNTIVGTNAFTANTTGNSNIAIGFEANKKNTAGGGNVVIGTIAMEANTTGNDNVAIGNVSGSTNSTGTNNIFLGTYAKGSSPSVSNEITLGNEKIVAIRSAVTSITSLSDARDKKNIKDLSLGMEFIQSLKPRSFQWDKREWYPSNFSDGTKLAKTQTAGFIAQELDESQQKFNAEWLNLVYKSNPEKLEANYGNLIPILVKAIQDLDFKNKELMDKINSLEKRMNP